MLAYCATSPPNIELQNCARASRLSRVRGDPGELLVKVAKTQGSRLSRVRGEPESWYASGTGFTRPLPRARGAGAVTVSMYMSAMSGMLSAGWRSSGVPCRAWSGRLPSRFAEIAGSLSAPEPYHYRLWFASRSVAVWQKELSRRSENTRKGQ